MAVTGGFAVLAAVQISLFQVGPADSQGVGPGRDADTFDRGDRAASAMSPQSVAAAYPRSVRSSATAPRQLTGTPWTLRFGPQRPDLVRYNRVEALSLGIRGQLRPSTPLGPLSVTAVARLGIADVHPNGRLDIAHESVVRRVVVRGYHELAAIEEAARHLGPANSLTALLWGRDDGDYYRRSGATLEVTPPSARPRTYRLRVFAEHHEGVEKETDVQLPRLWDDDRRFRPNIAAEDGWLYGASLELSMRSSTDRNRTRGGLHGSAEAAWGDFEYQKLRVGADMTVVLPARSELVIESATGTAWGSPPTQRLWYVGGPLTLRGHGPRSAGGEAFWTGRVELARRHAFGRIAVFTDAGWAGPARRGIDLDDALYSAGAGVGILDQIIRVDGAWQLQSPHEFRLDVYLDQIL